MTHRAVFVESHWEVYVFRYFMKKSIFTIIIFISLLPLSNAQIWEFEQLAEHVGYCTDYGENELINDDENCALENYVSEFGPYYEDINSFLRGVITEDGLRIYESFADVQMDVDGIDSAIAKVPLLPENLLLFRGSSLGYRGDKSYQIEEIFTTKAYWSTSPNIRVGTGWTHEAGVTYAIYSSKEERDGIVCNEMEDEVLLPRSQTFKVMDSFFRNKRWVQLLQRCQDELSCRMEVHLFKIKQWWDKYKREEQAKEKKVSLTEH